MIIAAALTQQALPSTCCVNSSRPPSHFFFFLGGGAERTKPAASDFSLRDAIQLRQNEYVSCAKSSDSGTALNAAG